MNNNLLKSALKPCELLVGTLLFAVSSLSIADELTCDGFTTFLYANSKIVLTICHGSYTKIDRTRLGQWQECDDATVYIRDKKNGTTTLFADCLSEAGKQYRVYGDAIMIRHFYTTYPEFKSKPLLVETLDLTTNKRTYEFEKQFSTCTRDDIENAAKQVDSTTAKPFDGNTYFTSVYGGFYKLRDCAKSDPKLVLSILRKYQTNDLFDGEVAETLTSVTGEVELIQTATMR